MKYLRATFHLPLTLFADSLTNIAWYVDALHQIHYDCKGHTGSLLTLGRTATVSSSTKHKIPSKSSCESKIIGLYDKVSDILWARQFLEAQGYHIQTNVVYQDNMSTLSLAKKMGISPAQNASNISKRNISSSVTFTALVNSINNIVPLKPCGRMSLQNLHKAQNFN